MIIISIDWKTDLLFGFSTGSSFFFLLGFLGLFGRALCVLLGRLKYKLETWLADYPASTQVVYHRVPNEIYHDQAVFASHR